MMTYDDPSESLLRKRRVQVLVASCASCWGLHVVQGSTISRCQPQVVLNVQQVIFAGSSLDSLADVGTDMNPCGLSKG